MYQLQESTIVNSTTELICNDPKRRVNEAESSENWQTAPELENLRFFVYVLLIIIPFHARTLYVKLIIRKITMFKKNVK